MVRTQGERSEAKEGQRIVSMIVWALISSPFGVEALMNQRNFSSKISPLSVSLILPLGTEAGHGCGSTKVNRR